MKPNTFLQRMDRLIHWLQQKAPLLFLFLFLLTLSPSCKKDKSSPPENPVPPKISTGATTQVASQNIGSGGATITINMSGNALNGMEITIPSGSFPAGNNIVVKSVEITGHQFGEAFHPVTPLIRIETDNEYSEQLLKFKIPVTAVTNGVYGAYFYDESSQTLEAIPCFERTGGKVEVNLQHFQSNTILNKAGSGKIYVNIIVSSVTESFLDGKPMLTTGYEPGTDDWEFLNNGSYLSAGGNCAGQSLSSIYYYYEQRLRKNAPPLFNRFDQIHIDSIWEDNPQGYRLASVTQQCVSADWRTRVWPMVEELIANPYTSFKLFKHAFRTTALPQLVYIRNEVKGYAHAMVAYKLDLNTDRIYVADPNKPGDKTCYIQYNRATQTWTPYNGATKAGDTTFSFEQISFLGVSAMIPWHTIRGYYLDFEAGNGGSGKFPTYELKMKDGTIITDGMKVTDGTLEFYARSFGCAGYLSGTDFFQPVNYYQKPFTKLIGGGNAGNGGIGTIYLDPGVNKIGFVISGINAEGKTGYLDFKWINIEYNTSGTPKVNISSNASSYFKYGYYKFKASLSGANLPANRKYEWRVMDVNDPPRTTVLQNDTAWLVVKKTGTYKVTCYLMEMPSGNIVAYGEKEITVNDPVSDFEKLGISHSTYVELYGDFKYQGDTTYKNYGPHKANNDYYMYSGYTQRLYWNGPAFFLSFTYKINPFAGNNDTGYVNGTITGQIASDGKSIERMTVVKNESYPIYSMSEYKIRYELKEVPMTATASNGWYSNTEGSQVGNYVTSFSIYMKYKEYPSGIIKERTTTQMDFNNAVVKPALRVDFYRN